MQEGKLLSSSSVLSKAGTVGRVVSRSGASWQVRWGKAELGRAGQVGLGVVRPVLARYVAAGSAGHGMAGSVSARSGR